MRHPDAGSRDTVVVADVGDTSVVAPLTACCSCNNCREEENDGGDVSSDDDDFGTLVQSSCLGSSTQRPSPSLPRCRSTSRLATATGGSPPRI